jgi:SAM-dependent methyltransferase
VKRTSPAALANLAPLTAALRQLLPPAGVVVELGSGTGEHAVHLARLFPHLVIQPSDPDPVMRASVSAWAADARLPNLLPPLDLDLLAPAWTGRAAAAVLCVNVLHVAPPEAVDALCAGAARALPPGGPLVVAGPFARRGAALTGRLARFDRELRAASPTLGVRLLEDLIEAAARHGLAVDGAPRKLPAEGDSLMVFRQERQPGERR